jgi:transcriptional regulator with XRE-family HTH domain
MARQKVITFPRRSHSRQTVVSEPVASEPAPPSGRFADACIFGEYLRGHRTQRRLSLADVAARTKLPVSRLDALERGDVARLPVGIYGRALVSAYASTVGLDAKEMVGEFEKLFPSPELPLPSIEQLKPPAAARREVPGWVGSVAAVLILCGGYAGLAYWPTLQGTGEQGVFERTAGPVPVPAPAQAEVAATTGEGAPASDIQLASHEAAPPPAPVENTLRVTSAPAGARVTVNGIGWGSTPLTIRYLPSGKKTVRVTKDGFESAETTITLAEDGPASVSLNLEALGGR